MNNSGAPQISVVMPVYNPPQRYLRQAIESITAQTFADFEFLIVDDSTDSTVQTLAKLAERDSRIRVLRGPGSGISAALNAGLAAARGAWIARMDGDDVAYPTRFARQLAFLRAHEDCVAVGTDALFIDADGDAMYEVKTPPTHDEIDGQYLRGMGGGIMHPTAMYCRKTAAAIGGYNERYPCSEDVDFFLRMAERGRLANVPETLLRYRYHYNNGTVKKFTAAADMGKRAAQEALTRRGLKSPPHLAEDPAQIDLSRWTRRLICQALINRAYKPARKIAWRNFCAEPRDWRNAACLALTLTRNLGRDILLRRSRAAAQASTITAA